ncbi:MAG: hypothetical protein IJX86_04965 [Lachnospiraceae bacterium]|nr:hypothetical protein [Lachnospiraceae bacterium]
MSVNGITGISTKDVYSSYNKTSKQTQEVAKDGNQSQANAGVVYESTVTKEAVTKKDNSAIVKQMQQDLEMRTQQLQNIVTEMLTKQAGASKQFNDIWSLLASGDFTVDQATADKAKEEISEDGYWGVNQTSDRIIDFAVALCNGDETKLGEMKAAFEKGFGKAEEIWGGELPEISYKTYDSVMSKFDELMNKDGSSEIEGN